MSVFVSVFVSLFVSVSVSVIVSGFQSVFVSVFVSGRPVPNVSFYVHEEYEDKLSRTRHT